MIDIIDKFKVMDPEGQNYVLDGWLQNLMGAKQWDRVGRVLGNLDFLFLKGQRYGSAAVLQDYDQVKTKIENEPTGYQDSINGTKEILEYFSNAFSQEFRSFQYKPHLIPQQIYNNLIANCENDSVKLVLENFAKRGTYPDGHVWFRRVNFSAARKKEKRLRMTLEAHQGPINGVVFSADKSYIASCGSDGTINIWSYREGKKITGWLAHAEGVTAIEWIITSDGKDYIVSCGRDQNIKIWDTKTRKLMSGWHPHRGSVLDIAYIPQSQLLITCGDDRCLRLWSLAGDERRILPEHQSRINQVAVSKSGRWILSGGQDHTLFLWDTINFEVEKVFYGHGGTIRSIAVSPEEDFAVVGGDDQIARLLDLNTGKEVAIFRGHTRRITCVAIARSAQSTTSITESKRRAHLFIASGSEDGQIILWDGRLGTEIEMLSAHADGVTALTLDMDTNMMASGGNDGFIRIWNASPYQNYLETDFGIPGSINCLVKHTGPDKESLILSGGDNHLIYVYEDEDGTPVKRVLRGHLGPVTAITSLEADSIASGDEDGNIIVWNITRNHIEFKLDASNSERQPKFLSISRGEVHRTAITHLARADKNLLISAGQDQKVRFWDLALKKEQRPAQEIAGAIESIVVIPATSKVAVAGTAEAIVLYDIFGATSPTSLSGHKGGISCIQAVDAARLVSGGRDGTVRVWNIPAGEEEKCLTHGSWIDCLSSDGEWVVSGARDGKVKLWNLSSGECTMTLPGHKAQIRGLSMYQGTIYGYGDDNTVLVWEISSGKLVAEIPLDSVINCMLAVSSCRLSVGTKQGEFILLQLENLR